MCVRVMSLVRVVYLHFLNGSRQWTRYGPFRGSSHTKKYLESLVPAFVSNQSEKSLNYE